MLPAALALASAVPLTWNEALSGVFGSISLASWIVVLVGRDLDCFPDARFPVLRGLLTAILRSLNSSKITPSSPPKESRSPSY